MTTTPTASPELPDLDHLEALARAATPWPWSWWTSNSTLRLSGADGRDGGVLYGYARHGDGDVNCAPNDQAFIAAANPAAVLALIALARRAQPEGEAPQADLMIGAPDPEAVFASFCDREGYPSDGEIDAALRAAFYEGINYACVPAATLSPLCGAQHADEAAAARAWADENVSPDAFDPAVEAFGAGASWLAAQQAAAPDGNWLWSKLMDWCKKRGVAPANFDDLFAIVGEARAAQLDGGQEGSES